MKKIDKFNVPENWSEIPYKNYLKLTNTELDFTEDVSSFDSLQTMIAIILEAQIDDLSSLKVNTYQSIINTLSFIEEAPERSGSKWSIKSINELTYDEFVRYEKMKGSPMMNQIQILSMMSGKNMVEISNMPVTEVLDGFFYLWKSVKRYINSSIVSLGWKIVKIQMKQRWKKLNPFSKKKQIT